MRLHILPHSSMVSVARMNVACLSVFILSLAMVLAPTEMQTWASSTSSTPAAPELLPVHPGPNGYFEYTLFPGAATSGAIVVHNRTASPASYLVYVTGATTSPVSGVAYGQFEPHPFGIAAWVQLSTGSVHLPSNGASTVHFTVAVPGATTPGYYVVALVAQTPTPTATTPTSSTKTSVHLLTTTRVIVAIVIHVPGPVAPAASFGRPSVGLQQHRQVFTIPIHDTGNVLMKPYLAGDLRNCAGGPPVLRLARQLDTFVPHTSINYPWYLNGQVLPAGCYQATLTLNIGDTSLASFSGTLHVGIAIAKVQPTPGKHRSIVHTNTGIQDWLVPAAATAALLLLIASFLLLRARKERRSQLTPRTP
jgi:hypothetical protein